MKRALLGLCLAGTAWGAGHPVTFSVLPGGGSVLDVGGKTVATQPAAEISTFVLRPKSDGAQTYTLVRPPFDSLSFTVHWDGQHWLRSDGSPVRRFELTRRVRIHSFPAPTSVGVEPTGEELPLRDGQVVVPSAWHPPRLVLRRPGFEPMPLLIPAAALDQPDARYPRRLLFMTPRYWQFYLLVGIAGAVAWRRRPRTPVPVPAPKPPEMAVKPVAFAPVMDADVAWMVGSSVVCQGGRRLTITRLLQKSAGTLVLEAVKPNPGDSPVTVRVLMEERWQQRAMAEHLDQSLRRFRTLTHPNLGKILDWGVIRSPDGASARPFLVGEKMTGESMRALLASGRACTSAEVLQWGADLLKALEQAHKRGFFHGAIQPECITVGPNGRARLVDFGWGADAYDGAYRAPEQRCDAPGDVYSVGVILGEFLPQPPSAVKSVLDRMRARDPAERYPTAEAALDALASL